MVDKGLVLSPVLRGQPRLSSNPQLVEESLLESRELPGDDRLQTYQRKRKSFNSKNLLAYN